LKRDRALPRRSLRASGALLFAWAAAAAHAGNVQPLLRFGDADVSTSAAARVVFSPMDAAGGADVVCAPADACTIPPGRYSIRLDSPDFVALDRPTFVSDTDAAGVPTPFALRVFPAARVELGPGRFPEGSVLTVLDPESGLSFKATVRSRETSVQVPARKVVAAVFRGAAEVAELRRPVTLTAGQHLELPENPPLTRGRGQAVVSLRFPASGTRGGNGQAVVRLQAGGGVRSPDVAVTADPWRWTGIWYDLPSGSAAVEVESKAWALAEAPAFSVPDRAVGFARELKVVPRPRLSAQFEPNDRLPAGEAQVDLLDCRRLKGVSGPPRFSLCTSASTRNGPVAGEFRFEGLDPVLHALRWKAGRFQDYVLVDLEAAESKDVKIPVRIHRVKGVVTRRGRPVTNARISWLHQVTGIESETVSDEEGRYEALLAPAGWYLTFLDGPGFKRHADALDVSEDREADFVVPSNETEVRVVDAATGLPVEGARVGRHLEGKGDLHVARAESVECDEDGLARLPPFPAGRVTVLARARGYRPSEEKRFDVTKESATTTIELRIEKGDGTRLRIVDAAGSPIQGAWAMLPSGIRSEGADAAGEAFLESALAAGAPLFVTTPAGALALARFVAEDAPVRVGPPCPPFTVRFLTADGRPVASEQIAYSIDGVRVPQPMDYLARLAAGGDLSSRIDGTLRVAGLPAAGVVALWPARKPDAVVTRPLPVTELLELPAP